MAEAIEMAFGLKTRVGPMNHVLDGVHIPKGRGNFEGERGVISAKTAEPIEMPFGLWTQVGPRRHVLDGALINHVKGQLLGERTCPGMPHDILPSAVQKWLN